MKYYLVALLDKDSTEKLENLQRNLCRKFRLYKTPQKFYIPLEIIEDCDINKINNIINKIIEPYKVFKVEPKEITYRKSSNRTIDLSIEKKGYLSRLSRNINETLALHGYEVNSAENDDFAYIPITKSNYTAAKYFNNETSVSSSNEEKPYKSLKIDRFEIWKSINSKRDSVVTKFPLRKY